jgi:hypothetical protein
MKPRNYTAIWLLTGFVVLFFAALTSWEVMMDGQSRDLLIGAWVSAFTGVLGYWIGTSSGSERKTDLLAQAPSMSVEE